MDAPSAPKHQSLWNDTAGATAFPMARSCSVDVAIVGGGLAGLTTAYLLKKAGKRVAVIEMGRVGRGNTSLTTAHLTWIVDQAIAELHGDHKTRAAVVLDAHAAAIDEIERIARTEGIQCDFERVPAYRFGHDTKSRRQIEKDVREARALGRDCELLEPDQVPVPAPGGAMRAPAQAKFHPMRYALQLALTIPGGESHVFENSQVVDTRETSGGWIVEVRGGVTITAGHLVIATHTPIGLVPQLQTRLEPYDTFVIAARIPKGAIPVGLYWDTRDPYQYVRVEAGEDRDTAIVGGADFRTGTRDPGRQPFESLRSYLRDSLGVTDFEVTHEWSGMVHETVDGVAYIGRWPGKSAATRFVATGFGGNGMTYSTITGMLVRDLITTGESRWEAAFDPARARARASAMEFVKTNLEVAAHFVGDRLAMAQCQSVDEVPPGEGRIVRVAHKKLAVYRDPGGVVTALAPECTHMGCLVKWNTEAKAWDCPCHGSRFHPTGEVMMGPAVKPMEPVELPVGEGVPATR